MARYSGFLNVNKPAGVTSAGVVARLRRLTGEKSIGHAGTLDPDATGVLPIAVGHYTRLLEWCELAPKIYRSVLDFGWQTHSGDASGHVIGRAGPPWPRFRDVEQATRWLAGRIIQIPPQVSALKINGKRHYEAVRNGRTVWPGPRNATVKVLSIVQDLGILERWAVEWEVSSGTYIRSLVRDLGFLLGSAATLQVLERVQVGNFHESCAWSLRDLESLGYNWHNALTDWVRHISLPVQAVDEATARAVAQGQVEVLQTWTNMEAGEWLVTYQNQAIAVVSGPPWRYRKVFVQV